MVAIPFVMLILHLELKFSNARIFAKSRNHKGSLLLVEIYCPLKD